MFNKVNFTRRRRRRFFGCDRGYRRWHSGNAGDCRVENREQDLHDDDKLHRESTTVPGSKAVNTVYFL